MRIFGNVPHYCKKTLLIQGPFSSNAFVCKKVHVCVIESVVKSVASHGYLRKGNNDCFQTNVFYLIMMRVQAEPFIYLAQSLLNTY